MPDDEVVVENASFSVPRLQMQDDDDENMESDGDDDEYVDEVVVSVYDPLQRQIVIWLGN